MAARYEPTQLVKDSSLDSLQIFLRYEFVCLTEILEIICTLDQCLLDLHSFLGIKVGLVKRQCCLLIHLNQSFNAVA